jgi:hypothetical protein
MIVSFPEQQAAGISGDLAALKWELSGIFWKSLE